MELDFPGMCEVCNYGKLEVWSRFTSFSLGLGSGGASAALGDAGGSGSWDSLCFGSSIIYGSR